MALTEFPMPDCACGRDQTKFLQPFLQFYGRLIIWLTTRSCKKHYVTETARNISLPVGGDLPERQNGASMTGNSESLREAADTKMEVLTTKYKTRVGFWTVRTMYEIGCLAQVTSELRRYGLTLLGISECRWTDSGRIKVATGETVLYSGPSDGQHREVVALILKKETDKCLDLETSKQSHDEFQTERTPLQHDCHTELRPNERQPGGNAEWRKDLGTTESAS